MGALACIPQSMTRVLAWWQLHCALGIALCPWEYKVCDLSATCLHSSEQLTRWRAGGTSPGPLCWIRVEQGGHWAAGVEPESPRNMHLAYYRGSCIVSGYPCSG